MTLQDLGYTAELESFRQDTGWGNLEVARVISEHKERYIVKTAEQELHAEIIGNLRYSARQRSDFPAVGDWVAITEYDEDKALIHGVFPRTSTIERQAVGQQGEKQLIAANIDVALIVQAVDRDFNLNRIERYLAICHSGGVEPVILLNKVDLIDEVRLSEMQALLKNRLSSVPLFMLSNATGQGIDILKSNMEAGKTYCLLGSSGVGKSSLVNTLAGQNLMETKSISAGSNRGRHITSHRELIVLESGAIIIDNPGMREVGLTDVTDGLELTFDGILEAANHCKFKDCTHTREVGCAVLAGMESGDIEESAYLNYLKMEREKEHFEQTVAEKRKKDKAFGKMVKQVMKRKNDYK